MARKVTVLTVSTVSVAQAAAADTLLTRHGGCTGCAPHHRLAGARRFVNSNF
jgi:hypothetical protein